MRPSYGVVDEGGLWWGIDIVGNPLTLLPEGVEGF